MLCIITYITTMDSIVILQFAKWCELFVYWPHWRSCWLKSLPHLPSQTPTQRGVKGMAMELQQPIHESTSHRDWFYGKSFFENQFLRISMGMGMGWFYRDCPRKYINGSYLWSNSLVCLILCQCQINFKTCDRIRLGCKQPPLINHFLLKFTPEWKHICGKYEFLQFLLLIPTEECPKIGHSNLANHAMHLESCPPGNSHASWASAKALIPPCHLNGPSCSCRFVSSGLLPNHPNFMNFSGKRQ